MLLPSRFQGEICVEKKFALTMSQNVPSFFFYCYAGCIWRGVGGIPSWLCLSCVCQCVMCPSTAWCLCACVLMPMYPVSSHRISTALLSIPCVSHKWSINMSRMCILNASVCQTLSLCKGLNRKHKMIFQALSPIFPSRINTCIWST